MEMREGEETNWFAADRNEQRKVRLLQLPPPQLSSLLPLSRSTTPWCPSCSHQPAGLPGLLGLEVAQSGWSQFHFFNNKGKTPNYSSWQEDYDSIVKARTRSRNGALPVSRGGAVHCDQVIWSGCNKNLHHQNGCGCETASRPMQFNLEVEDLHHQNKKLVLLCLRH